MSTGAKWFGRVVWLGILFNLCFAIPAIFAPDTVLAGMNLPPAASMLWLQNVGMLLLTLCAFYTPSAVAPAKFPTHTKLLVLSRWIASVFWFILLRQSAPAGVVRRLLATDLALAIVLLLLMNSALLPEDRVSLHGAGSAIGALFAWLKSLWQSPFVKTALVIVVVVGALGGYALWRLLLKPWPDFEGATPEEHFKHAPIGLSTQSRLP
jgi:hypothetical protein